MGRQLRRVALDFKWPLDKVWTGFVNPHYEGHHIECDECDGDACKGYSPIPASFAQEYYGYKDFDPDAYGSKRYTKDHPWVVEFATRQIERDDTGFYTRGGRLTKEEAIEIEAQRLCDVCFNKWSCHLIQADVDAIIELGSCRHVKAGTTADQVNKMNILGGLDRIDAGTAVEARCYRLGLGQGEELYCKKCKGHGSYWDSPENEKLAEEWEPIEPPAGEGYQVWETVSEGSPISPVFANPEDLAEYMSHTRWGADKGTSKETWLKWIMGPGWACSGVMQNGEYKSGVEFFANNS